MFESSDFNLTLSCISNLDEATNDTLNTDKTNIKTYPIRCSNCSNISILNADFKKNYFCTICDNSHKNGPPDQAQLIFRGRNLSQFKVHFQDGEGYPQPDPGQGTPRPLRKGRLPLGRNDL